MVAAFRAKKAQKGAGGCRVTAGGRKRVMGCGVPASRAGKDGGGRVEGSHAGRVAASAEKWVTMLKVSPDFKAKLTDGLLDMPTDAVWGLPPMGPVPQSTEDVAFGVADLETGCKTGVVEEVDEEEVKDLIRRGYLVSSAFTIWQGEGEDRKGRFVVNFSRQSKFWKKGSVRMERMEEFAGELRQGEKLISFDIQAGYRHVHLHPLMLNFFLFSYGGKTYRCLALPFGWGPAAMHFTRFLRPVVTYMRNVLGYRVLCYLDDLLIAPRGGRAATEADCWRASTRLEHVLGALGIKRHATKGVWGEGASELDHLGFHLSTVTMCFTVTGRKQSRMRRMAGKLLRQARQGKGMVSGSALKSFCGSAVSLTLAVPLARFHTRSLYDALTYAKRERDGKRARVRVNAVARQDLMFWRKLGPEGRCMLERDTVLGTHSDAADLGWGGTASLDLRSGVDGVPMQGVWSSVERAKTIAFRELRALRLVLEGASIPGDARGGKERVKDRRKIRCWVDNSAVVFIVKAMVTASSEMMPELRRLKDVLDRRGLELDPRWISSAENRYADRLSRSWDPSAPQISRAVVSLLATSLNTVVGKGLVFRYRLSGGEHPVAQRKQAEAALEEGWGDGRARFFNPPPELLGLTLRKMARENARGVVVVPLWLETEATARLRRMADAVTVLVPEPGRPLVVGARDGSERCPLLLAEVGLRDAPRATSVDVAVDAEMVVERAQRAWMKDAREKDGRQVWKEAEAWGMERRAAAQVWGEELERRLA